MEMPNGSNITAESSDEGAICDHTMVELETPEMAFRGQFRRWPDADDVRLAGGRGGLWSLISFGRMLEGR